ncbi:MAG: hypothetical protein ACRCXT_13145 [Paraclostridium sp.]
MNKKIQGYIIQSTIVDISGNSIGELPHYKFKILDSDKEIYVSDNADNLESDIILALENEGILSGNIGLNCCNDGLIIILCSDYNLEVSV